MHVHASLKQQLCKYVREAATFLENIDAEQRKSANATDASDQASNGDNTTGGAHVPPISQADAVWDQLRDTPHAPLVFLLRQAASGDFNTVTELHGSRPWIAAERRRTEQAQRERRRRELERVRATETLDEKAKRMCVVLVLQQ